MASSDTGITPKKVLILGASSAMAEASAQIWASQGAHLCLVARQAKRLEAMKLDLETRGAASVTCRALDLTDCSAHVGLIDEAEQVLKEIDVVLIAYGTLGNQAECEKNFEEARREIHTNFISVVSLLTIIANRFEKGQKGNILVITSVAGDRGRQSNYVYGSAKGALSIFLQGLRNRLAKSNVRVVTIKPGFVDTPMTAEIKKGPLFVSPQVVARGIVKAADGNSNIVYLPWFWNPIMLIIKHIPEMLFKKMKL